MDIINLKQSIQMVIIKCMQRENYELLEMILSDNNHFINTPFANGSTIIHTAIEQKDILAIRLLIKYKANLNIRNSTGDTPILYIIKNFDDYNKYSYEMLRQLLVYGAADVNKTDTIQSTPPLTVAALLRKFEFVKLLLNANANINYQDNKGNTILHILIINFHDFGHEPNIDVSEYSFVSSGDTESIQMQKEIFIFSYLLNTCVDPEIRNYDGKTALELAMDLLRFTKINCLLNYGVKFNYKKPSVQQFFQNLLETNENIMLSSCLFHLIKRFADDKEHFKFQNVIETPNHYELIRYSLELCHMKYIDIIAAADALKKTYYDIFAMNLNKLWDYLLHTIRKHYNIIDFIVEAFPLFGETFARRLCKAKKRKFYQDLVWNYVMQYIEPITMGLPEEILQLIVNLFNNDEILLFHQNYNEIYEL